MSQQQIEQEERRRREEDYYIDDAHAEAIVYDRDRSNAIAWRAAQAAIVRPEVSQNAYDDYYNARERRAKESIDHSAWLYGAADRPVHERTNTKEKAK